MPRSTGSQLPPALARVIDGGELEGKVGETFLLITGDEDGWPHVAMLSVGEVVATGPGEVRLALWPGSRTTANLERAGTALLMAVVPPSTFYVRLRCRRLPDITAQGRPLAAFAGVVEEVLDDVVAYAEVEDGIRFRLVDPEHTIAAWKEAVEAVRRA